MNLLIYFFAIMLAVLMAGSILLLIYYFVRSKSYKKSEDQKKEHFFTTNESLSKLSDKSDEILTHVKGIYATLTGDQTNQRLEEIAIEDFLDRINIKKRSKMVQTADIDIINFNVSYAEKDHIRYAVIIDKKLKRMVISSFMLFIKGDDRRTYKSLLSLNGMMVPKLVIREINSSENAICVEFPVYAFLISFQLYEYIFNMLINVNRQLLKIANEEKWPYFKVN